MGSLAAFGRLAAAGWSLARNDALLPRELDGLYPPRIATLSRSLATHSPICGITLNE